HHKHIANNNVSDALSREVMLYVQLGQYDKALQVLDNNYFRQWEGVSKAYGSFVDAHLLRGLGYYEKKNFEKALDEFNKALEYPGNMMVARPYRGGRECQIYYYIGMAQKKMGLLDQAISSFDRSAEQRLRPVLSDLHYYRGMSLLELEKSRQADEIFSNLIKIGNDRLESQEVDFFAKFGEKETQEDKASEAWYLIGLGQLGKGELQKAREAFQASVKFNINHVWANVNLKKLK
ncbi:MAG: tetratricopeptide repeat protein, partial [Cyclobacteriaceae bacterium]|nr:tetratricopeptide repeat protein [Cyclobacteriaceae bacterium]